ncbi:MAG: bifunctional adenosylcobinamide kinase/adenosylcobinamide-phosphate guanylyltransferase [Deltaproteobacteria bacterium]|nr:bifunctional adenosylcobinamide kinase/adenosylcobinamide-phosphate guanylyltransferase [Deltaproteobacteria bacterium]
MFKTTFNSGCILFTGGAKSGKSRLSLSFCEGLNRKKVFLATAQALDQEMEERIRSHKEERGEEWLTMEEPLNVVDAIGRLDEKDTVILIDCLTLWISNLFMEYGKAREFIDGSIDELLARLSETKGVIVVVTNEVGMGIVPDNELSRRYRDTVGSANQQIADIARKVVTVVAGLPLVLKDE